MSEQRPVYHLALRETYAAAGAIFEERLGWSLPMHFGDAAREYAALRNHAALFERSHRSRILVTGTDAHVVLDAAFEGHVHELEEGRSLRTVALDDAGNVSDLVLIARTGGIAYIVSGEPTRRTETLARLQSHVEQDFDVRIDDRTDSTCLIAIAGPAAADVVGQALSEGLPPRLPMLHALTFEYHGFRMLAMRTSDVGEDGFEFMVAPAVAQHMLETLTGAGVPLSGFEANECARIETCIPAFVPDLEPGLSPAEADIDVLMNLPGGREGRILAATLLEGETVPAVGARIRHEGREVGEIRSVTRSLALGSVIGLALLESPVAFPGAVLDVDGIPATIVAKPFYRRRA